ncbi:hypothetical protein [Caulobacter sp. 17J65-9]|uniref:hypothetical protein n=1 Tax=Caulobacter sp. 17J65-9 TaxID=2709382 RepID=UPI0013C56F2F|nr:hypothetical protein [Caulobacter sp. 17J65-9]NEX93607.1 hypothetical protein [Caulobacter sp. 17J65-9]
MSRIAIQPVGLIPTMRRVNGFGTTIAGRFDDPAMSPWYFKQYVFTALFVPILFGAIYAVQPGKHSNEWRFGGRVSGREFLRAYGWRAYWMLKGTVVLETVAFGLFMLTGMGLLALLWFWLTGQFRH